MRLLSIIGARPQFIKFSPVARAISAQNHPGTHSVISSVVVHTGQHYDYEMSKVFFDEMSIPQPHYDLGVGSGSQGRQTGLMIERIEEVLQQELPDIVLVFGDTNSTLAGALAAVKLHIPVAHVEAGLRSYNKSMPEEINRITTDHCSTILFCPTKTALGNLEKEGFKRSYKRDHLGGIDKDILASVGIDAPLVVETGDVMYDAILFNLEVAERRSTIQSELALGTESYSLLTIHRAENTSDDNCLARILEYVTTDMQTESALFPAHPRTAQLLKNGKIVLPPSIRIVPPLSYFDMLVVEKNAHAIYTDSGGVQKEALFLGVPCVTLRGETEWEETIRSGWNRLMGTQSAEPETRVSAQEVSRTYFGDGQAAQHVVEILKNLAMLRRN